MNAYEKLEMLVKARGKKDITKLIRKRVVDKNGHSRYVYVKREDMEKVEKRKKGETEETMPVRPSILEGYIKWYYKNDRDVSAKFSSEDEFKEYVAEFLKNREKYTTKKEAGPKSTRTRGKDKGQRKERSDKGQKRVFDPEKMALVAKFFGPGTLDMLSGIDKKARAMAAELGLSGDKAEKLVTAFHVKPPIHGWSPKKFTANWAEFEKTPEYQSIMEGQEEVKKNTGEWDNVPGYEEIQESMLMDNRPLRKKYPVADSYLIAESWMLDADRFKSKIGERAAKRIKNGDDHVVVIKEMEKEWDDHVKDWNDYISGVSKKDKSGEKGEKITPVDMGTQKFTPGEGKAEKVDLGIGPDPDAESLEKKFGKTPGPGEKSPSMTQKEYDEYKKTMQRAYKENETLRVKARELLKQLKAETAKSEKNQDQKKIESIKGMIDPVMEKMKIRQDFVDNHRYTSVAIVDKKTDTLKAKEKEPAKSGNKKPIEIKKEIEIDGSLEDALRKEKVQYKELTDLTGEVKHSGSGGANLLQYKNPKTGKDNYAFQIIEFIPPDGEYSKVWIFQEKPSIEQLISISKKGLKN